MDISKELNAIKNNKNVHKMIEKINEQTNILNKKSHILKVINLVNEIAPVLELLKNENIAIVNFSNYGSNSSNHLGVIFFTESLEIVQNPRSKKYAKFYQAVSQLNDFDITHTNGAFDIYPNIDKNIKEQIYAALLSKELKDILKSNDFTL